MRLRRALLGVLSVVLLGAAGFVFFSRQPALPAMQPASAVSFDRALIAKGAELALIGNCNVCHSKQGGAPYAGGRPLKTPFGTIYATNITPDADTGIGAWSETAFLRAMREGVRRDGAHLYPAFPYDHFTKASVGDLRAIYAFLMTREPVRAETPNNELPFPWSQRALIAGWKLLYFKAGELKPDPTLSAELNRGAYLVEGLAHCGACHTPRNHWGAEANDRYLGGGDIDGWHAPALNGASPAPVPWTSEQLFRYLTSGFEPPHGVAAGPMQPVANNLGMVAEQDVKAIAAYIGAMLGPATANRRPAPAAPEARATSRPAGGDVKAANNDGAIIYAGACALCHEPTGQRFSAHGIALTSSKVVAMADARNLSHVILEGIDPPKASPAALMPGFGAAFTDNQVAALMAYLRSTFSDQPAWSGLEETVREARQSAREP
ncbi:MAG TPA: cytochrome c [Hyphomicrobiaceae bacterium]|jgi:mono/diheme cytochrome c family protein|nr:cytochrome c [Hyphomicrobiaceae bacterium]